MDKLWRIVFLNRNQVFYRGRGRHDHIFFGGGVVSVPDWFYTTSKLYAYLLEPYLHLLLYKICAPLPSDVNFIVYHRVNFADGF